MLWTHPAATAEELAAAVALAKSVASIDVVEWEEARFESSAED